MKDEGERLAEIETLLRAVASEDRRRAAEYIASSGGHLETRLREVAEGAAGASSRRRLYRGVSAAASLVTMAVAGALLYNQYGGGWPNEQTISAAQHVKTESVPQEKAFGPLPVPIPQSVPTALAVGERVAGCGGDAESVPEHAPVAFNICSPAQPVEDAGNDSVPKTRNRAALRLSRARGGDAQAAELVELLKVEAQPYAALCAWFEKPGVRKRQILADGRVVEFSKGNIVVRRGSRVCVLRTQEDTLPEELRAE